MSILTAFYVTNLFFEARIPVFLLKAKLAILLVISLLLLPLDVILLPRQLNTSIIFQKLPIQSDISSGTMSVYPQDLVLCFIYFQFEYIPILKIYKMPSSSSSPTSSISKCHLPIMKVCKNSDEFSSTHILQERRPM